MSRHFTGASSEVMTFNPGTSAPLGTAAASTFAFAVWWRATTTTAMGLIRCFESGGTEVWSSNPFSDGNVYFSVQNFANVGSYTTGQWYLMIIVKAASGTVAVRAHIYTPGTGWTHNSMGTIGDRPSATHHMDVGHYSGTQYLDGDLAVMGAFGPGSPILAMSDGAIEAAGLDVSLTNWTANAAAAGFIHKYDQPVATAVLDLTGGGADQTAITGTTYSASDPPGFSYGTPSFDQRRASAFMTFF